MSHSDLKSEFVSKFEHNNSYFINENTFSIASKVSTERSPQEKKLLFDLLNHIHTIKQTFKDSSDYKLYLYQCSDYLEALSIPKGTSILLHGDKCNEIFIIIKGLVNIYGRKTAQQIQKQKEEHKAVISNISPKKIQANPSSLTNSCFFNKNASSQTSLVLNSKRQNQPLMKSNRNNPSIEDISELPSTERVPSQDEVAQKGFTSRRRLKIKSIVAFLRTKADSASRVLDEKQEKSENPYNYLPLEEQLLLEDEDCQRKYFKEGACLLTLKDRIGACEIINEKCLLQEFRSSVTLVAQEDVQCIKLNREMFRKVLREEIEGMENKKEFFLNFFQQVKQGTILHILEYISQRKYRMHEKIYNQGDKSKGVYFIKKGEVRLFLNAPKTYKDNTEESYEIIDAVQAELFLPHQHKTMKKHEFLVGLVGQGDFFGEEDIVLGQSSRRYTVISCSEELVLYYIPQKYYTRIYEICPEFFKMLEERAKQRNDWLEDKIRTAEVMKERILENFQGKKRNVQTSFGTRKSKEPTLIPETYHIPSFQRDKKDINKFILFRNEDIKLIKEGNVPGHFLIARDKANKKKEIEQDFNDPKEQQTLKTWVSSDKMKSPQPKDERKRVELKHFKDNPLKSMEMSPSHRLFVQEKIEQKIRTPKFLLKKITKSDKTMTGLDKKNAHLRGLHNLIENQKISSKNNLRKITSFPHQSSTASTMPQFEVKSYSQQTRQANTIESPTNSKYYLKIDSPLHYHPKRNSDLKLAKSRSLNKSRMTSPFNIQSAVGSSKFESSPHHFALTENSPSTGWSKGTRNDAVGFEDFINSHLTVNIHMKNMKEHKLHPAQSNSDLRTTSRSTQLALSQLNDLVNSRSETEPSEPRRKKIMVKSLHNNFRLKTVASYEKPVSKFKPHIPI